MGKALGAALTVILAVVLAAGCGDGDTVGGASKESSSGSEAATFRVCHTGARGGGYRVRVVAISCRETRRILPDLIALPGRYLARRARERVWRNRQGWVCLIQGAGGHTDISCVRGSQVIVYRFA